MTFFAPMSEEHGRISAVTATRILQRMVNGDVGVFDEDAFAEVPMGSAERLRSALKNMGRRSGINADESVLDVFENLVNKTITP